jgi:tetratricopeptide (TPR) repeat protein
MPKRRVSKKKIKETDEHVSSSGSLVEYVMKNYRNIIPVGIVVVFIAIVTITWIYYGKGREKKASYLFSQSKQIYQSSMTSQTADKPVEERYQVALEKFEDITKTYSGTSSALESLLYIGDCYYHLKKYDPAIDYYTQFINKSKKDSYLRSFAFEGLGYCYEGKGDYEQALSYFKKSVNEGTKHVNDLTYLNIARCYGALNDKANALEFYKKFAKEQDNSIFSKLAQDKIELLEN